MILYRQNYAALTFVPKPRKRKPILSIRPRRVRGRRKPDAPTGATRPAFDLLSRIDEIRERHGLSDSAIGRQAVNDPNLVYALRDGRRIREQTRARIVACLDLIEGGR